MSGAGLDLRAIRDSYPPASNHSCPAARLMGCAGNSKAPGANWGFFSRIVARESDARQPRVNGSLTVLAMSSERIVRRSTPQTNRSVTRTSSLRGHHRSHQHGRKRVLRVQARHEGRLCPFVKRDVRPLHDRTNGHGEMLAASVALVKASAMRLAL